MTFDLTDVTTNASVEGGVETVTFGNDQWKVSHVHPNGEVRVDLGTLALDDGVRVYRCDDRDDVLYLLAVKACEDNGNVVVLRALLELTLERVRSTAARVALDRQRKHLASYKDEVRASVLDAYDGHKSHITLSDLNEFLDELGLAPLPLKWEVRMREVGTRDGVLIVEAPDEQAALSAARRQYEQDSDDIDWEDWEDATEDLDYTWEVEEHDE